MITITLEWQHFKEKFQDKLDLDIICKWLHGSSLNTRKPRRKRSKKKTKMLIMLITSTCLILASIASPASSQPTSPPQSRLSCNFLTCTGSILGESLTLFDNLSLQVQLRLVSTLVQPRRCSSVWRTSWTALARETARLASATLYQGFARARMWSLLRQNHGKYLTLNPNWRLRKIFTWGVTFSHALDPSWVRSDLNKKKKTFLQICIF